MCYYFNDGNLNVSYLFFKHCKHYLFLWILFKFFLTNYILKLTFCQTLDITIIFKLKITVQQVLAWDVPKWAKKDDFSAANLVCIEPIIIWDTRRSTKFWCQQIFHYFESDESVLRLCNEKNTILSTIERPSDVPSKTEFHKHSYTLVTFFLYSNNIWNFGMDNDFWVTLLWPKCVFMNL